MNHLDLLKRAFHISWRYRPLWLFGFLLALCGGGGGGGSGSGGSGNVSPPSGGGDFGRLPTPHIDLTTIIAIAVAVLVLVLLLIVVGIVVRAVTRTALIGMVHQIEETEAVTVRDGWRLGWSRQAWRIFLINLLIGLPLAIVSLVLIMLALSPLLLLLAGKTALTVVGVGGSILAFLAVLLVLLVVGALIWPIQELAWRRTVLDRQGVFDSVRGAFGLIKGRFKDAAILWLLMVGLSIGWAFVSLIVVLPISLVLAGISGGIPALAVYLLSHSWVGAAIAGIPLGLLVLILVSSFAGGLYLTYQSSVWTLGYLALQKPSEAAESPADNQAPPAAEIAPASSDA